MTTESQETADIFADQSRRAADAVVGSIDPSQLSGREFQVFVGIALGLKNSEIAQVLGIAQKTVDSHRAHVLRKTKLRSNVDVARAAVWWGVVDLPGRDVPRSKEAQ